jgi:hypothetical protein
MKSDRLSYAGTDSGGDDTESGEASDQQQFLVAQLLYFPHVN